MRRLIVVSGDGRGAGKTVFAERVADRTYAIAGGLRDELTRLYPKYNWHRKDQQYKDLTVVKEAGNRTIRQVMIDYGERQCSKHGPAVWANQLVSYLRRLESVGDGVCTIAVDDVRKLCELEALKVAFGSRLTHVHIVNPNAVAEPTYDNDKLKEIADYCVIWHE